MVIEIHPETPQPRLVRKLVDILQNGGLIIYPTDTVYALGTLAKNKNALERIRRLKARDKKDLIFTVMCEDISAISNLVMPLSKDVFKIIKKNTPGPVTFILKANKNSSKWLNSKRDFVGVRIPDHELIREVLGELDDAFVSTSLRKEDEEINPFYFQKEELIDLYEKRVDAIVLSGTPPFELSTVINFEEEEAFIQRQGKYELKY